MPILNTFSLNNTSNGVGGIITANPYFIPKMPLYLFGEKNKISLPTEPTQESITADAGSTVIGNKLYIKSSKSSWVAWEVDLTTNTISSWTHPYVTKFSGVEEIIGSTKDGYIVTGCINSDGYIQANLYSVTSDDWDTFAWTIPSGIIAGYNDSFPQMAYDPDTNTLYIIGLRKGKVTTSRFYNTIYSAQLVQNSPLVTIKDLVDNVDNEMFNQRAYDAVGAVYDKLTNSLYWLSANNTTTSSDYYPRLNRFNLTVNEYKNFGNFSITVNGAFFAHSRPIIVHDINKKETYFYDRYYGYGLVAMITPSDAIQKNNIGDYGGGNKLRYAPFVFPIDEYNCLLGGNYRTYTYNLYHGFLGILFTGLFLTWGTSPVGVGVNCTFIPEGYDILDISTTNSNSLFCVDYTTGEFILFVKGINWQISSATNNDIEYSSILQMVNNVLFTTKNLTLTIPYYTNLVAIPHVE